MNGLYSLKQLLLLLLLYAFQYNKITIKCLFLLSWLASLATLHKALTFIVKPLVAWKLIPFVVY